MFISFGIQIRLRGVDLINVRIIEYLIYFIGKRDNQSDIVFGSIVGQQFDVG